MTNLAPLFRRDLERLRRQIEAFPNDDTLWRALPGVTNSAGNLALHLEGNLREYIGRQLGHLPYVRTRQAEFDTKGLTRAEIAGRIELLVHSIPAILDQLAPHHLAAAYPEVVLEHSMSNGEFLLHLYGHLNWHLGQIDYLRRIVTGATPADRAT